MKENLSKLFCENPFPTDTQNKDENPTWKFVKKMLLLDCNFKEASLTDLYQWCKLSTNLSAKEGHLSQLFMESRNAARREIFIRFEERKEDFKYLDIVSLSYVLHFFYEQLRGDLSPSLFEERFGEKIENRWIKGELLELRRYIETIAVNKAISSKFEVQEKIYCLNRIKPFIETEELLNKISEEGKTIKEALDKEKEEENNRALQEERKTYPMCPKCGNNENIIKKHFREPFEFHRSMFANCNQEGDWYYYCTLHKEKISLII